MLMHTTLGSFTPMLTQKITRSGYAWWDSWLQPNVYPKLQMSTCMALKYVWSSNTPVNNKQKYSACGGCMHVCKSTQMVMNLCIPLGHQPSIGIVYVRIRPSSLNFTWYSGKIKEAEYLCCKLFPTRHYLQLFVWLTVPLLRRCDMTLSLLWLRCRSISTVIIQFSYQEY